MNKTMKTLTVVALGLAFGACNGDTKSDGGPGDASVDTPRVDVPSGDDTVAPDVVADAGSDAVDGAVIDSADGGSTVDGSVLVRTSAPCGAAAAPDPTLPAGVTPVFDLGHVQDLAFHQQSGDRIVARETSFRATSGHWVLWDAVHRTQLASGEQPCPSVDTCPYLALSGSTLAVGDGAGNVTLRDAGDGHVIATRPALGASGLSVDGTYFWNATATTLTTWSIASGTTTFTRAASYAASTIFGAPTELLVANGPAGNVIEHIALPGGTSTMSPAIQGTSPRWFLDGSHVVTFPASGSTGWIYGADGTLAEVVTFMAGFGGGIGSYWWTGGAVFLVGHSAAPVPGYSGGGVLGAGGDQLGFARYSPPAVLVAHLTSTGIVTVATLPDSLVYDTFAGDSSGHWSVSTPSGLLFDGRTLNQSLSCGPVSATGSPSGFAAVFTQAGTVVIVDARSAPPTVLGVMPPAVGGAWSADGSILVLDSGVDASGGDTLTVYSMPAGVPTATLPFTLSMPIVSSVFALSADGHTLAQSAWLGGNVHRRVVDITGTSILDVTVAATAADATPALSADGTYVAFGPTPTTLYHGSAVVGTPSSQLTPVGWPDDMHLVAQDSSGLATFDPTGLTMLGLVTTIPRDPVMRLLGTDRVFLGGAVSVYNRLTGASVWTHSVPASSLLASLGAAAGSFAVYAPGVRVVAETLP